MAFSLPRRGAGALRPETMAACRKPMPNALGYAGRYRCAAIGAFDCISISLFRFPNQKEKDNHNDGFSDPCDEEPEESASVFP